MAASEDEATVLALKVVKRFVVNGVTTVIFDFDKTLTGEGLHVCGTYRDDFVRLAREFKKEDFADGDLFLEVVRIGREHGLRFYVATYGHFKAVLHCLMILYEGTGVPCPFSRDTIITPSVFESIDGCRDGRYMPKSDDPEVTEKNLQLLEICAKTGANKEQVAFFDDTEGNVINALAVGYKYSYVVNKSCGLTTAEFSRLLGL